MKNIIGLNLYDKYYNQKFQNIQNIINHNEYILNINDDDINDNYINSYYGLNTILIRSLTDCLRIIIFLTGLEKFDETDFDKRASQFGDNVGDKLVPKSFWTIFIEAMGDIMLKILLVCAIISIVFECSLATEETIGHGMFFIFLNFIHCSLG